MTGFCLKDVRRWVIVVLPLSLGFGVPLAEAGAQSVVVGDSMHAKSLFTWRDGVLAAGFAGIGFAMLPVDRSLAQHFQNPSAQSNHALKSASRGIQSLADPGSLVLGLSLYGIGRAGRWSNIADLGLHTTEAVALSGLVTSMIKVGVGRARPYISGDTRPDDFSFGRGLSDGNGYQSFPSGHTTVAFAAAAVVTSESRRWWPNGTWLVAPLMYGGATAVGLSRMYNNAHWASDVVAGAAIGTFSGLKVVRYNHAHHNNVIDRWLLGVRALPTPDGRFSLTWSSGATPAYRAP